MLLLMGCWLGCAMGPAIVVGGGSAAAGVDSDNPLPGLIIVVCAFASYAVLFFGALLLALLQVDMHRRIYNGEMFPMLSPGVTLRAIKANPGAFVLTWLGMAGANLMGSLGAFLCYVGLFLTLPLAGMVGSRILAQWDAIAKASEPPADPYSYG